MRLRPLALGMVIIFVGLIFVSVSQAPAYSTNQNEETIGQMEFNLGETNFTFLEVNVTLNQGDKFKASYSGGSYVMPEEVDVIVIDPIGNETVFPYQGAIGPIGKGLIANSTGTYTMRLSGVLLTEENPHLVLTVRRIDEYTVTYFPNSNLLPIGLVTIVVGAAVSLWATISSRRKGIKGERKRRIR